MQSALSLGYTKNMIKVYYRTYEAMMKNPFAFSAPEEGLVKDDYTFVAELGDVFLEEVFRQMNIVDGDELPVKLKVRSMSSGDVVVDEDGEVWYCAGAGWEKTSW